MNKIQHMIQNDGVCKKHVTLFHSIMIYTDVNRAGGRETREVSINEWKQNIGRRPGWGACINLRSITINVISTDRNDSSSSLSKKNWGETIHVLRFFFRQRYYLVERTNKCLFLLLQIVNAPTRIKREMTHWFSFIPFFLALHRSFFQIRR